MFIVSILLLAILALSAVSASEDISDDVTEMEPIEEAVIEESSDDSQDEILTEDGSSITDFKNLINNGGEINLTHDYQYDSSKDQDFTNVSSNKAYVLDGKGHTIDGNGKDMEIYIGYRGTVIKNTVFKNFVRSSNDHYSSLIYWFSSNSRLENCTFENINVSKTGVIFNNFQEFDMVNCTFRNCNVEENVAYISIAGGQVIDCTFINNTGKTILHLSGGSDGNLLNNCSFIDNAPKEYLIDAHSSVNEKISNCRFINNNASQGGNYLVGLAGHDSRMENCSFTGNVMGDAAKAMVLIQGNRSTMKNCSFEDNHIGSGKGVVQVGLQSPYNSSYNSPDSSVSNLSFKDNYGIPIVWSAQNGNISDCTFINNLGQVQSNGIVTIGDGICDLSVKNVSNKTSFGYISVPYDRYSDVLVYLEAQTHQQGNVLVYLNGEECCNETIDGYNASICTNSMDKVKCGLSDILVKFIGNDGTEMLLYEGKVFIDYYAFLSAGNYLSLSPHVARNDFVYLPEGFTGTVTLNDGIQSRILNIESQYARLILNGSNYGLGDHYFNISLSNDPIYPDKTIEFELSIVPAVSYQEYIPVGEEAYISIDLPDDYDDVISILNNTEDYYPDAVVKEISGLKGISKFSITDLLQTGDNVFYINCSGMILNTIYMSYIENDPEVSSSIDSDTIEYGDDVILRLTVPDSNYYLYYVYVDGRTYPYYGLENEEYSYRIPYLDVGEYTIDILVYKYGGGYSDPAYINRFSVTVKEKAKPDANSTNVTVPAKVVAKDYSAYYNKGTYSVTVYGTDGKVAKNTNVVFKINGKKVATVKTDSKGVAKVKIPTSYAPKTYKISATALGKTVTKKLTIKQVLTLKAVTVKKSAKKLIITATLKEGKKAIKSKKISFKFNGKAYSAKTNSKGIAKITIKAAVLKKLKVGKKVTYQATYLKDTVKRTVKVKK